MPGEDNVALVAQFLVELWNNQNLGIINRLTVENYVLHLPQGDLQGRQAFRDVAVYYLFKSFSRIQVDIESQISQDSQVVTRVRWNTEINLRDQSSGEEINRKIPWRGVSIDRIDNGRIAESWNMLDPLYSLYNIQVLSRDPVFVQFLPAARGCSPKCSASYTCKGGQCVLSNGSG